MLSRLKKAIDCGNQKINQFYSIWSMYRRSYSVESDFIIFKAGSKLLHSYHCRPLVVRLASIHVMQMALVARVSAWYNTDHI